MKRHINKREANIIVELPTEQFAAELKKIILAGDTKMAKTIRNILFKKISHKGNDLPLRVKIYLPKYERMLKVIDEVVEFCEMQIDDVLDQLEDEEIYDLA